MADLLPMNTLPAINGVASFNQYLYKVNRIPSLTEEEEFMLAKQYLEQKDISAAHKLVVSHLKLVAKIALKYTGYGLPIADLVSEGTIGLMKAVKKYKPDLGHRLSTYAMWWIKAYMQEYILKSWSLVKIGTTVAQKKLFFSLGKIKRKILNLYGREMNQDDYAIAAEELDVKKDEVAMMHQRIGGADVSLNNLVSSGQDGASQAEMLSYLPETRPNPEMIYSSSEDTKLRSNALKQAMSNLSEREIDIINNRQLSENPVTLEVLSNKHNVSKERIRQIEHSALRKIKEAITSKYTVEDLYGSQ